MKKKLSFAVFFCFISLLNFAQTHSVEVWTAVESSIDLSREISLDFEAETRFQQTSSLLKQATAELDLSYSLSKMLYTSVGYKFSDKYKKTGYFPEHTLCGSFGLKRKFSNNLRLAFRSKLELSKSSYTKNAENDVFELQDKNKLKITYANKDFRIKPSISIETYHPICAGSNFHVSTIKYSTNCSYELRKNFDIDLGYMFRQNIDEQSLVSIFTISLSKTF